MITEIERALPPIPTVSVEVDAAVLEADCTDCIEQANRPLGDSLDKNRANLCFHRAAMFGRPYPQLRFHVRIKIANSDCCHCYHL
jgi:hypothetical protein